MNKNRIGQFDRETYLDTIEIEAYGTYRLEDGMDTIALVGGDFPVMQIICDGRPQSVYFGQCLPTNGRMRYLRNPFSRSAKFVVAHGHPVDLVGAVGTRINGNYSPFSVNTRSTYSRNELTNSAADEKWGFLFMSRRSTFNLEVRVPGWCDAYIIPKAKLEYMASMPASLGNVGTAYHRDGMANRDVEIRHGTYKDTDMVAWIAAAEWEEQLVPAMMADSRAYLTISPDTAVIVNTPVAQKLDINVDFTEFGNFDSEDR